MLHFMIPHNDYVHHPMAKEPQRISEVDHERIIRPGSRPRRIGKWVLITIDAGLFPEYKHRFNSYSNGPDFGINTSVYPAYITMDPAKLVFNIEDPGFKLAEDA
jgi:hypothetical protein